MQTAELVLAMLVAVVALVLLADRLAVPYPVLLVLGGLGLGFIPGLPSFTLDPDLIFLLILPPLLQYEAFFTSLRDLRANGRLVGSLAVGLVLATTGVVAVVAHASVDGLPWAAAFVLGAIVSPPDAVSFSALADRIRFPQRLVAVLKDEGLINDATALTTYRVAVAAVVAGTFSPWSTGVEFVVTSIGGVLVGLVIGWLVLWFIRHVDDSSIAITISLASGFAAYLIADLIGVSGVLAVVTAGLYRGRREGTLSVNMRLQSHGFWQVLVFLVNGGVFIVIGLQLPRIIAGLGAYPLATLLSYAASVALAVILTRIVWVFAVTYVPVLFRHAAPGTLPPWQETTIIAWSGMRGIISLASALALPMLTASGAAFPQRDLIVFLTFCTILVTLVLQGLSLPVLVRWLGVHGDSTTQEEAQAYLVAITAATKRLDELASEEWAPPDMVERLRALYERKASHVGQRAHAVEGVPATAHTQATLRLHRELLMTERNALLRLREEGTISDEVLRRVELTLDLAELQLNLR